MRTERVAVTDGEFDLHVWTPEGGRGPGLLLIQEIFGVGAYIQDVAEGLARDGFVVAAPDVFWRLAPGWAVVHTPEKVQRSLELAARFDEDKGLADLRAALAHLRRLPEVDGRAGTLGFCFGGTMAYRLAAAERMDAAVSFYGSGVPAMLDLLDRIEAPLQLHFGGSDPYIARDRVAAVERAVAGRSHVEIHVQEDGGHAFHNHRAPMFHQPGPAARAWEQAERFLSRHLPR
ncbi:dienelactone hydrolase family protein [Actinomadura kijaniata]|uniref:Carboxymethylenebutenolidase n=1 Tax=Actinomadura namibiensis TaxID=182080 RepID=A0A7W3LW78_ACTNM|nr:dienelactone hydrolase family protein [Actinomadura namibiensis]MBA8955471.1 carboxymethylenebutenolidase [Actinomadura namibiensis]